MIKFNELQIGDFVMAEYEGQQRMGEVVDLNAPNRQVCVETEVQEFWYEEEHLYPITLNDEALKWLQFTSEEQSDGSVKYKKGSFRILIPKRDDFSTMDIWYREDKRVHPNVHYVHQLQNHYQQMTKIHLTKEEMV